MMYTRASRRARRSLLLMIGALTSGILLVSCDSGPGTPPDQPPTVRKELADWLALPGAVSRQDLRLVFDGNNLTYSAKSDAPDVVAVSVSDHTLTWTAQSNAGRATVTVTASNSGGRDATRFQVDVAPRCIVGDVLNKEESCMVTATLTKELLAVFYVNSDGEGCVAGICHLTGWTSRNGFEVSRSGDAWTIEALPLL